MSNMPKYVLAVDHYSGYKVAFSYYSLKSKTKLTALAEAAIRATKAKQVYCWLLLVRSGKGNSKEYDKVIRFYPNDFAKNARDRPGNFDPTDDDINGSHWGTIGELDID